MASAQPIYKQFRNFALACSYYVIAVVLVISYIVEWALGGHTLRFMLIFFTFMSAIAIYEVLMYQHFKWTDTKFAVWFMFGYSLFYAYAVVTSRFSITFCYVIPTYLIIFSYGSLRLIRYATSMGLFYYLIALGIKYATGQMYDINGAEIAIAIACLGLCIVFGVVAMTPIMKDREQTEILEEKLEIDQLTRCFNRVFLEDLKKRWTFTESDCAVIMGDINFFKHINDNYGHAVGDVCLTRMANILLTVCAGYPNTWPIRVGGDEFVIVTKRRYVKELISACDSQLAMPIPNVEGDLTLNVSWGWSFQNFKGTMSYEQMAEEADVMMYNSKRIAHAQAGDAGAR